MTYFYILKTHTDFKNKRPKISLYAYLIQTFALCMASPSIVSPCMVALCFVLPAGMDTHSLDLHALDAFTIASFQTHLTDYSNTQCVQRITTTNLAMPENLYWSKVKGVGL